MSGHDANCVVGVVIGKRLGGQKRHLQFSKGNLRGIGLGCLMSFSSAVAGQSNPPKIHQKMVDEYGVERKTGRFALPIPPLLSIGGSGDAALTASFGYVDGSDFQQNVPAWKRVNLSVYDGKTGKFFDYITIEFDGSSDTFRRQTGTTGDYVSEYPSGASYTEGSQSSSYVDKFGNRVTFGPSFDSTITVDYPDGRQTRLYYSTYNSGTTGGSSISFQGNSPDRTIVNSFGYALKLTRDSAYRVQAINLSQDYCDPTSAILCSTTQPRQMSISNTGASRVLTDAAGAIWVYRFDKINAYDRQRVRQSTQVTGPVQCDTPTSADYWYPVGITPPGAGKEIYVISYTIRGLTSDCTQDPTHDDVFVSSVKMDSMSAGYTTSKRYYGSYGSNQYNLSFWLDVSAQTQQGADGSTANRPNPDWGASRRSLVSTTDRLNRQASYNFNDLVEPAGVGLPLGNGMQLSYDTRYNVIKQTVSAPSGSSQQALITTYTYESACTVNNQAYCNKPLTMIDPLGNETDYVYNALGQIISQTFPSSSPGGPRPRKVFSYTYRTAYIKDSGGNPVAAGPAISMLMRTVDCSTSTPCSGTSDEIVTDYDYGPTSGLNNLKLRGVAVTAKSAGGGVEIRRSCYVYNYFGEKIAETKPLGSGAGCP